MTSASGPRPLIRLHFVGVGSSRPASYRLAGLDLASNREIEELAPFAVAARDPAAIQLEPPSWVSNPSELPTIYEGAGWIGGREVRVSARAAGDRHRLELEDRTVVSVFERPGEVVVGVLPGRDPNACRFAALGPGLAIGLAVAGCFSLHAAAVVIGGRALVLMGESGSGKSTMARLAFERSGCRRVADDVVPVWVEPGGELRLGSRFPQLKLDRTEQWIGDEEVPCRELLAIHRQPGIGRSRFSELSRRDAVLALLESTVASRLFSKELRRRELDTWVSVAGRNRILEWLVPDDAGRIAENFESLVSLPG